jgi:hypothetical protein
MDRTERIKRLAYLQYQYGLEPASLYMACRIMDRACDLFKEQIARLEEEFLVIADTCYGNVARYRLRFDRSLLWKILDQTDFYLPLDGFFSALGRYTYQYNQNTPLWSYVTMKICLYALNEDPATIILALVLLHRKRKLFPSELMKQVHLSQIVWRARTRKLIF